MLRKRRVVFERGVSLWMSCSAMHCCLCFMNYRPISCRRWQDIMLDYVYIYIYIYTWEHDLRRNHEFVRRVKNILNGITVSKLGRFSHNICFNNTQCFGSHTQEIHNTTQPCYGRIRYLGIVYIYIYIHTECSHRWTQ
jgi:hypothetical protein